MDEQSNIADMVIDRVTWSSLEEVYTVVRRKVAQRKEGKENKQSKRVIISVRENVSSL